MTAFKGWSTLSEKKGEEEAIGGEVEAIGGEEEAIGGE